MTWRSKLHGLVDHALASWMPTGRLYAGGFGDMDNLRRHVATIAAYRVDQELPPIEMEWLGTPRRRGDTLVRQGRFLSPAAGYLPSASRYGLVEQRLPLRAPHAPVCLMLAATAEEGMLRRRVLFGPLVRRGLGALILENPFYGARRPGGQRGPVLRTVEEQFAMNLATVEEGRALLRWMRDQGYPQVGVTGYSQGGIMAAFSAALVDFPVAVVPRGAARAAEPVFNHHALSRTILWERLAAEAGGLEAAKRLFAELLAPVRVDRFPPPRDPRRAILLAARSDGFIPSAEVAALHHHWPGSELRWLDAGHITSAVVYSTDHRRAVLDAFSREDAFARPEP